MKSQNARIVLRGKLDPKAERRSRLLRACSCLMMASLFIPLLAISSEGQLDSITVEAKKKEREELRLQIDQFVKTTVAQHAGESLARWNTPVCPLVAGLPRDQGEFILRRLSQSVQNAGAPLAPESCKANFFILVSSQADEILEALRKKRPGLFDTHNGLGPLQHFLRTERPVRVWQNSQNEGDDVGGSIIAQAFIGLSGGASMGGAVGTGSSASAMANWPTATLPNSRLSRSVVRSIHTAIIIVDLTRIKSGNLGQLSDYFAMVGLAEINLDQTIVSAPSVLRLFSEPAETPPEGMSPWDQALLKSLYASRAESVMQVSEMKTHMVDSIAKP
ncbi:MAG: hypothetical protein WA642_16890 [Steroidobacteraceae bacterium]